MAPPAHPPPVAVTAGLHSGVRPPAGADAPRALAADLSHDPPALPLLAGDVGAGDDFAGCLRLFDKLPCRKALVPGNHDVWVRPDDPRGDSLAVYREHLPHAAAEYGFHYLDAEPLVLADSGVAVVGSMNWDDYSWAIDRLPAAAAGWQGRLGR